MTDIEIFKPLAVVALRESPSNPRKRFDDEALKQLGESILANGIVQPLVVRPAGESVYEILAGARRYRAAKLVGLKTVPCIIRDLSDEHAALLQAIENLQRQDLHPIEEAEGYEYLAKTFGYSVDDIAAKASKSASYVRGRMKFSALTAKAREWFFRGLLTPTTALLIARIPVPSVQDDALQQVCDEQGQPRPATELARLLQREFMLDLTRAPFPVNDSTLAPKAGPCGTCPKRSGNQPDIFGDVRNKDTCTDPTCWAGKRAAHLERAKAAAKAAGGKVITGKAAAKIIAVGESPTTPSHVALDDRCPQDPKGRTYRQIAGEACPPALMVETASGKLVEVVERKAIADTLREHGAHDPAIDRDRKREAAARLETSIRQDIFTAIRLAPVEIRREELAMIATAWAQDLDSALWKRIATVWDWRNLTPAEVIAPLSVEHLSRLLLDMALVREIVVRPWDAKRPAELLEKMATIAGISSADIRANATAAERAKQKANAPKKTASPKKKKAAPAAPQPESPPAKKSTSSKKAAAPAKKKAKAADSTGGSGDAK